MITRLLIRRILREREEASQIKQRLDIEDLDDTARTRLEAELSMRVPRSLLAIDEAQELLAKYQRRQREAEEEAEAGIIEQAKKDAGRIAAEARAKIEDQLERRAKAAEDKIARAESQAIAEVRGQTVELAIEAARDIIRSRMDQGAQSALAERAIDELRGKLH